VTTTHSTLALGIDIGGTRIKAAVVAVGARAPGGGGPASTVVARAVSRSYVRPSADELVEIARAMIEESAEFGDAVRRAGVAGLCVPGIIDAATLTVTASHNLPGLIGTRLVDFVERAFGRHLTASGAMRVVSDAYAAAFDYYAAHESEVGGRLAAISLGTGVGMAVLDDGEFLAVTGSSSGHIGQMDVAIAHGAVPTGPDGAAGTLEAYIGLPALRQRYGSDLAERVRTAGVGDAPLAALGKAIRIVHAIYRPNNIVLLGGIGLAMRPHVEALHETIGKGLTTLARPGWTLRAGDHDLHAAIGAARLAAR